MTILEQAYQDGVKLALTKLSGIFRDEGGSEAWPALLGSLGGAIAAPEGKGLAAFGGTMGGRYLGALGGGAAGAGAGALLGLLAKRPGLGAALGGLLGGAGGSIYGGIKGYRAGIGKE